jgi:hypothetical protein
MKFSRALKHATDHFPGHVSQHVSRPAKHACASMSFACATEIIRAAVLAKISSPNDSSFCAKEPGGTAHERPTAGQKSETAKSAR